MFVVPKGAERKPCTEHEVRLMPIEPRGVLNTSDAGGKGTAAAVPGSDYPAAAASNARMPSSTTERGRSWVMNTMRLV